MKLRQYTNWQQCDTQVFWGEIAPCDHLVQVYDNEEVILDSLEGFVSSGFEANDSVIIIATEKHLTALNKRLRLNGFDLDNLQSTDQYIPLDAEDTLSKFMVNGSPDAALFSQAISKIVTRAKAYDRRVRAYGEMVAILWGLGYSDATVQLETLWNRFCETEAFCLFCAYPRAAVSRKTSTRLSNTFALHILR